MSETLTGRSRHRLQRTWLSFPHYLVLQVEVVVSDTYTCPTTCDTHTFSKRTVWRDAKVEDLTVLNATTMVADI